MHSTAQHSSTTRRPASGAGTTKLKTKTVKPVTTLYSKEDTLKPCSDRCNRNTEKFKIHCGTQEYEIQKLNDIYIVKPCSLDNTETFLTSKHSSLFFPKLTAEPKEGTPKQSVKDKTPEPKEVTPKQSAKDKSTTTSILKETCQDIKPVTKEIKLKTSCWKVNHNINRKSRDLFNSVNQAIKLQKVFTIGNQNKRAFPTIREALKSRGWVEKGSVEAAVEEEVILTKMSEMTVNLLKEAPVNFIWVISAIDFATVKDSTIVSRFPKNSHFTTKVGLCSFLEEFYWFYEQNVSNTLSPRTFKIATGDDIDNFINEFGLTACIGLLKVVIDQVANAESDHFFRSGKVPIDTVDFANAQCSEYILHKRSDDIDRQQDKLTTAKEWTDFLSWFYLIAHEGENFQTTPYPMIQALYTMSKMTLKNIEPYWPQLQIEGCKNLWVVKPAAQFCGRGVKVMKHLDDIIGHVKMATYSKLGPHVIQKYIERPLLVYNTKFDIRQWFLVTSVYPLVIWIYTECYLRFSSQPFTLEDLHESIHLTNNAIQKNYTNNSSRHSELPQENMWHCLTFQEYLTSIGEPEKWNSVILPGIKEGIVGAVLASQNEMIDRQNSFELYGADFLLGEDYTPILLEINMGPSMAPSTNVTAPLCKNGLEDVIKVVLDRRHNLEADTGKFEILYKQEMGPKQHHIGLDLMVFGSKITPEKRSKKL